MNPFAALVNFLSQPEWLLSLSCIAFFAAFYWKPLGDRLWTIRGGVYVTIATAVFFGFSMLNPNFRSVVTKPDNVPIAVMIFLVIGYLWTGMVQAWDNDKRIAAGGKPSEYEDSKKKVWVWPDLLMIEFITILVVTIVLIVWSIVLKAPLEERANPTWAPNPSKAPWYFLGLQELLVYFDPWIAGVLLPGFIIVGLIALPYCDTNKRGNGYFSFEERKYTMGVFMFGFLILWILLILLGTFLRGPNWNFFGPYEEWTLAKVVPLTNINLSEYFWARLLGIAMPANWVVREVVGFLVLAVYFGAAPLLAAKSFLKRTYEEMKLARYIIMTHLLLWMLLIPIKMVCRWIFNLKYIVYIPEYFFNV